ncbi:hydroxymethylpyrimidine/phosphomethylpyrimidine kinase [Marmoricola endophyticus]|uniref:Hydroxymethylpyrimidine/phosphomethylpyrimidine kinase n=1 Tax=Marmoricola endophyticus TaxID=2040280 RepID=A0A917BE17_9ACTN|nr:hydroxymethylpyrimidine/phosphomethylpyrimidine kinase [Marmoricola endophyticus]
MLAVAGSDPSGGAGVQADLKTATALGVYAAAALTALTAQNTTGVQGIHAVPPAFVSAQITSVVDDLDVRAVKTGMLGDAAVVSAVADALGALLDRGVPLVLDPVTVATSGDVLVPEEAVATIVGRLLPRATVVTPNLPEARLLTGLDLPGADPVAELTAAGEELCARGARYALVKGGHLTGDRVVDVLVGPDGATTLEHDRVPGPNTHGTGCTLSSGIAARLAAGDDVPTAVRTAHDFLQRALRSAEGRVYGAGHGPVDHLEGLR